MNHVEQKLIITRLLKFLTDRGSSLPWPRAIVKSPRNRPRLFSFHIADEPLTLL